MMTQKFSSGFFYRNCEILPDGMKPWRRHVFSPDANHSFLDVPLAISTQLGFFAHSAVNGIVFKGPHFDPFRAQPGRQGKVENLTTQIQDAGFL